MSKRDYTVKKRKKNRSSRKKYNDRQQRYRDEIRAFLNEFDIEEYRQRAGNLDRRFILHVGPTNSGKTYEALQALKTAERGVYLGPLRLLALEMFDTLNEQGVRCELLTGEEFIRVDNPRITASTIELCDYRENYDVAVIDEAQLISDPRRGSSWTKALFLVKAKEVHVCLSVDAEKLIRKILEGFGAEYEVKRHERLAPLIYSGQMENIKDVSDGDAVIVFSRKAVLATAGELEKLGKSASVIYGALPPASRREEVRKFASGENKVVVSTDAIGMGISLPIKRVIFREISKYDGEQRRLLNGSEIRQIAGRAGRFGIYDRGEVLTMAAEKPVKKALERDGYPLKEITLPFPKESIETSYPFDKLFEEWAKLPVAPGYAREDMSEAALLYGVLGSSFARKLDRKLLYDLITCPVDVKNEKLVLYWLECCIAIGFDAVPEEPGFETDSLAGCELQYKAYDVRHQLLRRIGIEEPCIEEKNELCEKINQLLLEDKSEFSRKCSRCGRPLPVTFPYGICDRCFRRYRR